MTLKNVSSISFEELENSLSNWKLPRLYANELYHKAKFCFRSTNYIKTIEKTLSIRTAQEIIHLLSQEDLKEILTEFKYLHLGFVQVAVKPLTRKGLNTFILGCLKDCKNLNFADSLLGLIKASLAEGPVFFNVEPNFSVSLIDQNIIDSLVLNLQTSGFDMKPGS